MGRVVVDDKGGAASSEKTIRYKTQQAYRRTGPAELGRGNASACVTACFDEFIPNVEDACRQLQQPKHQQSRLWDLYCCDSLNCGVYIGAVGQSPNVDLIINKCQNIGFSSIEDPGPPRTDYCASSVTLDAIADSTLARTSATIFPSLPAFRTWSAGLVSSTSTIALDTPTSAVPPLATTSALLGSLDSTGRNATSAGLPRGVEAAIGIFSIIAALAIITALLLICRKRRRHLERRSQSPLLIPYRDGSYHETSNGSQAPLVAPPSPSSSSRNPPLTPPAKLRDRAYLHPAMTAAGRSSATSSIGNLTIPPSSIFLPTNSKLMHKHERRATASGIRLPSAKSTSATSHGLQGSVYSLGSGPGASSITVESNKASSVHSGSVTIMGTSTPPLSPMKLPRAHEGLLESVDLATPAGPPPKRALPPPPLNHPNSPTFSPSPVSPLSPTFPPRTLARGDHPIAPAPFVSSNSCATLLPTTTSASMKEPPNHRTDESHAREARESWGSWSGVGGGVNPKSRKRGSGSGSLREKTGENTNDNNTPVPLQDLDLEKLCGRC